MSWDEPHVIAQRLATRLDVAVGTLAGQSRGDVLLLDEAGLATAEVSSLQAAAAIVGVGAPAAATSAGLTTLRHGIAARGLEVALATFATAPGARGTRLQVPVVVGTQPGDAKVRELLAAGPHSLLLDAAVDTGTAAAATPGARVCVVSFEVSGMTGGGIGTASTALAETLARAGHEVTLLFTGWQEAGAASRNDHWRGHFAARDLRLEFLRVPGEDPVLSPHYPVRTAYEVYRWLLRQEPFDVVHLPENMGQGAYAQAAKRQGSAFADTTFVIGTHGPTRWAAEANRVVLTRDEFLVNDALERASVARADVLLGPSRYLHDYLRDRGWALPHRVHVQPYARPAAVRTAAEQHAASSGTGALPHEVVFFGRLETRKGVATLCDALDRLAAGGRFPDLEVTFLGPVAEVYGTPADAYLAARAARWPWEWRIVGDRDQPAAAEYLRRPGVIAVMPSTVDNAPNTVSEAIALGVPLIAGHAGGTGELVAAEQRDDHMFGSGDALEPHALHAVVSATDARPLAELLEKRLSEAVLAAAPAVEPTAVDAAYDRWHRAVRRAREGQASVRPQRTLPSLAVCVLFDGDRELLEAQLTALDSDAVEVVVADLRTFVLDGSTDVGTDAALAPAAARDIAIVRPERSGHAAEARNAAVAATRGSLIAFVPPGDVPLAGFADGLRRAVAATGAGVCGCVVDGDGAHVEADAGLHAYVPLSGPPLAGITYPAFAAGPYAIQRELLAQLGGFTADAYGDEADHELLNRAAVAGCAIEVVPEPLARKRRSDRWTAFHAAKPHVANPPYSSDQSLRVARVFAGAEGRDSDAIGLLLGARIEGIETEARLREQRNVYEARAVELRTWVANLEQTAAELRIERDRRVADLTALRAELEALRAELEALPKRARDFAARAVRDRVDRVRR